MSYQTNTTPVLEPFAELPRRLVELFTRGDEHRRRLEEIDVRIVVSGTRGKSGLTKRLYDVLYSRGYDAYAKVTGNHPVSLYDGEEYPIERGERVTLYENIHELKKYNPTDALVLENQGITDYTTRLMNEVFGEPHILVVTNVRQDHRDTLGKDRAAIARSFARATPSGTHVVNGERDPVLREYMERELEPIDATITHVDVPPEHEHIPGAETVYAVNDVLETIGEPPLSDRLLDSMLDTYRVEWTHVPGGRVYNAADVNDVESTEMVRRALVEDDEQILPFVYLRRDRRARTASFLEYLDDLYERDAIESAYVGGGHAELFAEKASFPVVVYDAENDPADECLEQALANGHPVLIMGNTVASFMRDLEQVIERREIPSWTFGVPDPSPNVGPNPNAEPDRDLPLRAKWMPEFDDQHQQERASGRSPLAHLTSDQTRASHDSQWG